MPSDWSSDVRSEEHTSELQSHDNLVCRLLLEKKTNRATPPTSLGDPCARHRPAPRAAHTSGARLREPRLSGSPEPRGQGTVSRGFFLKDAPPPEIPPFPLPNLLAI